MSTLTPDKINAKTSISINGAPVTAGSSGLELLSAQTGGSAQTLTYTLPANTLTADGQWLQFIALFQGTGLATPGINFDGILLDTFSFNVGGSTFSAGFVTGKIIRLTSSAVATHWTMAQDASIGTGADVNGSIDWATTNDIQIDSNDASNTSTALIIYKGSVS